MTKPAPKRISLCMIVRNEEAHLAKCLDSVRDHVDELVVVDTGSEDSTVAIAQGFNARVHRYAWTGDFSEARNCAIGHATGEWILVLDADETLAARDAAELRLLAEKPALGFKLIQRTYLWNANYVCASPNPRDYEEGNEYTNCLDVPVIRFFRNDPRLRYSGRVHELLEPVFAAQQFPWENTSLVIHHFGKVGDPKRLDAKKQMYLDLGQQKANDDPTDAMAQFELGVQLYELGRHAECIPRFKNALQLKPEFDLALLYIAKASHESSQPEMAERYFREALRHVKNNDRVLFDYANFVRDSGDTKRAAHLYEKALKANPEHALAHFNLGALRVRLGEALSGLRSIERALALNPDNAAFYTHFARLPLDGPTLERAAQRLEAFLHRFPHELECRAALGEARFRLNQFDRAIGEADSVLRIEPNRVGSILVRGSSLFATGQLDAAAEAYRAALAVDARNFDALINLGAIAEKRADAAIAASCYVQALDHRPDRIEALRRYAVAVTRNKSQSVIDESSIAIIERACRTHRGDPQCLTLAAGLLEHAGHLDRAAALYRDALNAPQTAELAERQLQRLEGAGRPAADTESNEKVSDKRRVPSCHSSS